MQHLKWSTEKPVITEECILLSADFTSINDTWFPHVLIRYVHEVEDDGEDEVMSKYWNVSYLDGEDWGPYENFKATSYAIIAFPAKRQLC